MTGVFLALSVGLAGAAGAVSRVWLDLLLTRPGPQSVPLGTLIANTIGSAILGAVLAAALTSGLSAEMQAILSVGLCGGLSTYSSFSVATMKVWLAGHYVQAGLNAVANFVLGYVAAAIGWIGYTTLAG